MLASVGATMMWLGERVHMGLLPIGSANMRVARHGYLARAVHGLLELRANVEALHRRRWADFVARRGGDARVCAACAGR